MMRWLDVMCVVCAAGLMFGCDDKPAAKDAPAAASEPGVAEAPAKVEEEAKQAAYPCPSVSETMVEAPVPADHGLKVAFDVPEGFVWSNKQPNEHGDVLKIARFELPFKHEGQKRYQERLLIVEVEQSPEFKKGQEVALLPSGGAYQMGSGSMEVKGVNPMLAGDVELAGQKAEIRRARGDEKARFMVRLDQGATVNDLVVSVYVSKVSPVMLNDTDARVCVPDYDRIGLAVAKSLRVRP